MPSATMPTTVATGIRRLRMQSAPPICPGSTVIRVNLIPTSVRGPSHHIMSATLRNRIGWAERDPWITSNRLIWQRHYWEHTLRDKEDFAWQPRRAMIDFGPPSHLLAPLGLRLIVDERRVPWVSGSRKR